MGSAGAGGILAMITSLLLGRLMGPSGFGTVALSQAVVLFALVVAQLGLVATGARYIAAAMGEEHLDECWRLAIFLFLVMLGSSILMSVALWYLSPLIGSQMASEGIASALYHFTPFGPFIGLLYWSSMVLKGMGWNVVQAFYESFLLPASTLALAVPSWCYYESVDAVILAYGAAYASTALISAVTAKSCLPGQDKTRSAKPATSRRELLWQSTPLALSGIGNRLLRRGDILVVGSILGDSAAGLYRAGNTVATVVRPLLRAASAFALHHLARSHGMKRSGFMRSHFGLNLHISLLVTLPIAFVAIIMATELLTLLFGPQYTDAAPVVQILAVAEIIMVGIGPLQTMYGVYKANWMRLTITLLAAPTAVLTSAALAPLFGVAGAAVGSLIGLIILAVGLLVYGLQKLHIGSILDSVRVKNSFFCIITAFGIANIEIETLALKACIALAGAIIWAASEYAHCCKWADQLRKTDHR
ncbi:oligosaccharide flippase family protein [Halospina sp. K52047b]|uniref:lipopolysaccharide biosynthesis protein n=1 Tax=Halospina sp. K52047b TaxID=2614160 RepID=UPI001CE4AE7D|nr:oligosaccharide flippase family protein [Halospina sp. K52047b]